MACEARLSKGASCRGSPTQRNPQRPTSSPLLGPAHWEDTRRPRPIAKLRTALGPLGAGRKEGEGLRELPVNRYHFNWFLPACQGPSPPIPPSCPHTQCLPTCSKSYPAIPLLGMYQEKTVIRKDTRTSVFTAALFTTAKTRRQPKRSLQMRGQRRCGVYTQRNIAQP